MSILLHKKLKFTEEVLSLFNSSKKLIEKGSICTVIDVFAAPNNPTTETFKLLELKDCIVLFDHEVSASNTLTINTIMYFYNAKNNECKFESWSFDETTICRCLYDLPLNITNIHEFVQELYINNYDVSLLNLINTTTMEVKPKNYTDIVQNSHAFYTLKYAMAAPKNNDGNEFCYFCGEKTEKKSGFRRFYDICPICKV